MSTTADAKRVRLAGVHHDYGDAPVLHNVDLEVASGETMVLLGPSGCGKTTLLRIIAGLERATAGSVSIGDRRVTGPDAWVPPEGRRVGMVFQDWALFPHLTVGANVGYGLPRGERDGPRVRKALAMVGLADLVDRMPSTLSGGQQQRVALARALAPEPGVLLLDEPFSNLDTVLRVEVRTEVHRLLRELGITSIFVTHDQEEAFVLGERVAVMREGLVVQVATPRELYTAPADRGIAEFVGSGTILETQATGGMAESPIGPVPVGVDTGPVDLLLRPEQLAIRDGANASVELVEYYGHDAMVFVSAGDLQLRVRCGPDFTVRRGDRVAVEFVGREAVTFPRPAD